VEVSFIGGEKMTIYVKSTKGKHELIIDDKVRAISLIHESRGYFSIDVDTDIINIFNDNRFIDTEGISKIRLNNLVNGILFPNSTSFSFRDITVIVSVSMYNEDINRTELFHKYLSAMKIYFDENELGKTISLRNISARATDNISVDVEIQSKNNRIVDEVQRAIDIFMEAYRYADSKHKPKSSLDISFDFPQEVATACEQYLLYFTDFLRELGIDAGTNISHEAGKTLFSVVPANADQALQQIREALDIYLHIPVVYTPGTSIVPIGDIPTQQLMAQVSTLNTQLILGAALIQSKEAVIQAQQAAINSQAITIATQQRVLNGEILVRSIQDSSPGPSVSDEEPVLGGTVILGRAGPDGAQINIAELYRKLRNLFRGK
jgi:hypothetical protein